MEYRGPREQSELRRRQNVRHGPRERRAGERSTRTYIEGRERSAPCEYIRHGVPDALVLGMVNPTAVAGAVLLEEEGHVLGLKS